MTFKTPIETYKVIQNAGIKKANLPFWTLVIQSFFAGAYIAFGGFLAIVAAKGNAGEEWKLNKGLQKLVFGGVFPFGLMAVVITGAELFTGNCMCLAISYVEKKIPFNGVIYNGFVSWIGNLVGSLCVAFMAWSSQILEDEPFKSGTIGIAHGKVCGDTAEIIPWYCLLTIFVKAIGCNWLVCLAVWQALAAEDIAGKILAIWWPIMAFVALGFEHSVANMFFIPTGIFYGADSHTIVKIWFNLLVVTLGNIIGGSFFMGLMYFWVFGEKRTENKSKSSV